VNRDVDARLTRSAVVLEEAAAGAHAYKAQLAKRKLAELKAKALLDTTAWGAKNTSRRIL